MIASLVKHIPSNNRIERIWKISQVDFMARYYNDKLGLLWALLNPLFKAGIFYYVFQYILKHRQENFGLFIFSGIVLWSFFAEATKGSMHILKKKEYLISNIQFNWIDLFISHVLSIFLAFLFNFSVFIVLSLLFGIVPTSKILLLPIAIFPLILICFATSLVLAVTFPFFRDLNHLWDMLLLLGFWISGIFFSPAKVLDILPIALYANPMLGIIHNIRACVLPTCNFEYSWLKYNICICSILVIFGLWFFHRFVHLANERI